MIVPAILEKTKAGFDDKVSLVCKIPGVERIQVDFADNIFVPNLLLTASEIDTLNPAFHWEAHLMCQSPKEFLDYKICGFKTIIVHYEAYGSAGEILDSIKTIKQLGLEPGICLKLETPVSVLRQFYPEVKHFLLMAIVPGFQGTKFYEEIYSRVLELNKVLPNAIIEVDGGVNETNIKKLKDAGTDLFVVGSAITKSENPGEAFEKLTQLQK